MVRLVDEALRDDRRFGVVEGLASPAVTLADPAMGTGTFLLGVLQRIAERIAEDEGEGAVPGIIRAALGRLIGFEMQFGPFAVAQLRLTAEVLDLMNLDTAGTEPVRAAPVSDQYARQSGRGDRVHPQQPAAARRVAAGGQPDQTDGTDHGGDWEPALSGAGEGARRLDRKRDGPGRRTLAGLDAAGRMGRRRAREAPAQSLSSFSGAGRPGKSLRQLRRPNTPPATPRQGIVCFITVAGFLNGPGFREDARRSAPRHRRDLGH